MTQDTKKDTPKKVTPYEGGCLYAYFESLRGEMQELTLQSGRGQTVSLEPISCKECGCGAIMRARINTKYEGVAESQLDVIPVSGKCVKCERTEESVV